MLYAAFDHFTCCSHQLQAFVRPPVSLKREAVQLPEHDRPHAAQAEPSAACGSVLFKQVGYLLLVTESA